MKKLNANGARVLSNQMMRHLSAPADVRVDRKFVRLDGTLMKLPRRVKRKQGPSLGPAGATSAET